MHQLRITVIHPLGTFAGVLTMAPEDATYDNCQDIADGMQEIINGGIERLVLVRDDGSEIAFRQTIIEQSILIFKIEEVE